MPGKEMTIYPGLFMFHQCIFRGSLGAAYAETDFLMFLRWHREGKFPLDEMVTRRYQRERIDEACGALESGEILGRAILEY